MPICFVIKNINLNKSFYFGFSPALSVIIPEETKKKIHAKKVHAVFLR